MFKAFWKFFAFWSHIQTQYSKIKADEEKAKSSSKLGTTAIILSVISAIIVVGAAFGTLKLFDYMNNSSFIIGLIGLLVCIAALLIAFVQGVLGSLFYSIYQMKLNKKPIGWISLVVWFACVILAVVGVLLVLGTI